MTETDQRVASNIDLSTAAALAFPPVPVADEGRVRLGGQAPMFLPSDIADAGDAACNVALGGQAPMFLPDAIADAGLVRLGGQSPAF